MEAWAEQKAKAIAAVRAGLPQPDHFDTPLPWQTIVEVTADPGTSAKAIWLRFPSWAQLTVCLQNNDPWQVLRVLEPMKAAQKGLLEWLEAVKRDRSMQEVWG